MFPHTVDIDRLVVEIAARCEARLERQGFGADDDGLEGDGAPRAPAGR